MMYRKILISVLSMMFLVSTTGLPVTINFCKMADFGEMGECTMHHKPVKSRCCSVEVSESSVTISFNKPDCCQTEFIYNKVSDDFIYNKSGMNFYSTYDELIQPVTLFLPAINSSFVSSFYSDSSPPFLINPELHITNSIFLI